MTATLSDILLNPLLLYHTAPYLSLRSICVLIRTCRAFRAALLDNNQLYRYVNLEETILQMLKRVPEYEEIHVVFNSPKRSCPICGADCRKNCDRIYIRGVDSDEFSDRFEVINKDCLLGLLSTPSYGIHELGEYIGITSKQIQAINSNKGALKRALSMPMIAILINRLISASSSPYRVNKSTSADTNYVYDILVNMCIKLTRVALNVRVGRRELIKHVRILVLDGIKLGYCLILQEVINSVRRGLLPLSLLSVRETGLLGYEDSSDFIARQIELSAEEDAEPPSRSTPSVLGIYLFGRKDSPSPHVLKRGSGTAKAVSRDGKRKKKGSGRDTNMELDDDVISTINNQLGTQWQAMPGSLTSYEDSQSRSSSSSATHPAHGWYRQTGEMIPRSADLTHLALRLSHWNTLMRRNEQKTMVGMRLAFDGVLCPGPRHDEKWIEFIHKEQAESRHWVSHLVPRLATVALGPDGCWKCGSCPERAASWPESSIWELPLLSPVPKFEPSARKAQCPWRMAEGCKDGTIGEGSSEGVRLIVRCQGCLEEQYDARTKKWECEYCFFGVRYEGELDILS